MADVAGCGVFLFRFDRAKVRIIHDHAVFHCHVGRRHSGFGAIFKINCYSGSYGGIRSRFPKLRADSSAIWTILDSGVYWRKGLGMTQHSYSLSFMACLPLLRLPYWSALLANEGV